MANDEIQSHEELLPELNCFFISASRHDRDRIEVQIGFDGLVPDNRKNFTYDVDFLVFAPRTLGLFDVEDVHHLRVEFQSYLRLHSHTSNPKSETSLLRVRERLALLEANPSLESVRNFAIELEALLKAHTKKIRKLDPHSILPLSEIEAVEKVLGDFRLIVQKRKLAGLRPEGVDSRSVEHDLLLLNEFASHLYVQFLVEASGHFGDPNDHKDYIEHIKESLKREAQVRKENGFFLIESRASLGGESKLSNDLYLRRIGLLKKFFQKSLFISAHGETLQKKLLIPVYAISAAIAATWAIMVQIYQVQSMQERVGINSILLITIGVTSYVAKDIMKDFFRRYFFSKSSRLFPDFEKKLFIKRNNKKTRVGKIKEFLRMMDNHHLPKAIRQERYKVPGGEIEEFLNEDVFHFRKEVELDLSLFTHQSDFPWGLREILRYRFDRLLVSMEDPFKRTHGVLPDGTPVTQSGHRVYHVYFAVRIAQSGNGADRSLGAVVKPSFKAFRVTLDKTGVLDCKQLEWEIPNQTKFV